VSGASVRNMKPTATEREGNVYYVYNSAEFYDAVQYDTTLPESLKQGLEVYERRAWGRYDDLQQVIQTTSGDVSEFVVYGSRLEAVVEIYKTDGWDSGVVHTQNAMRDEILDAHPNFIGQGAFTIENSVYGGHSLGHGGEAHWAGSGANAALTFEVFGDHLTSYTYVAARGS
jgi:hypothetical protein